EAPTVLAGSKNSPETDCLANQNDIKSSLSDFFTSTDCLANQNDIKSSLSDFFTSTIAMTPL
ncbi:MAG: hypothetical protein ACYC6J_09955, partial [Coriobacteriia bacterium]